MLKSFIKKLWRKLSGKNNSVDLDFNSNPAVNNLFVNAEQKLVWDNAIKQHGKKFIKQFENNIKLYCYSDSLLSQLIYTKGFEESEIHFVKHYLKKGDVFVDIGANIGLFTVYAANCVGETGKVISFEPTPLTFERLNENIKLNELKNVSAHRLAISEKEETLELSISKDGFDAWNSLAKPTRGSFIEKTKVECIRLDDAVKLEKDLSRAALIKLDVEGWELFALKGGREFFSKDTAPGILIEFTDQNSINAGTTSKAVYEYLNFLGYQLFRFDPVELNLSPAPLQEKYPYENLIASKNPERDIKRLRSN